MILPNANQAIVEREKIVDDLLNPGHRCGASKARFFSGFGFTAAQWRDLAAALLAYGQTQEVKRCRETGFAPRYEVEGRLRAAEGRSTRVRSVWQMDRGAVAPRLRRAYPLEDCRASKRMMA